MTGYEPCLIAINTFLALAVPDVNEAEVTRHLQRGNKFPWFHWRSARKEKKEQARPFAWPGVC